MLQLRNSANNIVGLKPYDPKYFSVKTLLSANENPDNLPEEIVREIKNRLCNFDFNRYPDPLCHSLREVVANVYRRHSDDSRVPWAAYEGLRPENIIFGNGGDELLLDIFLAWGGVGRKALVASPSFSVYEIDAQITSTELIEIPRRTDFTVDEDAVCERLRDGDIDIVLIASPNNPTGDSVSIEFCERLLSSTDALVLIDEAYSEFADSTVLSLLGSHENLAVLHTFSKAFSLASARLGYLLTSKAVIEEIKKVRQPYSVDGISQLIAELAFEHIEMFLPRIDAIKKERDRVFEELNAITAVQVFKSQANFIMIRLDGAHEVYEKLFKDYDVLLRDFSSAPGLADCLRITIGTREENDTFLQALKTILYNS